MIGRHFDKLRVSGKSMPSQRGKCPDLMGRKAKDKECIMLSDDQVRQFELFGFVILRNIFTEREVATLQAEFKYGAERTQESEGEFDGTETHTFSMLGEDTPFYSSLLEDPRFYGPASQLFGDDVFGLEINSYRYISNTPWHFNDGSPNIHGYGPKYQFPVFEPTRADTGALRFVPGSHKDPWQSQLTSWWPLGRDSARSAEGMEYLDKIPCFVAEADPGDAVLFDMRLVHSTWGGSKDRRMSCVTYYHYPETPQELEVMRNTAQGFYNSTTRWNQAQWDEWFSNPHDSPCARAGSTPGSVSPRRHRRKRASNWSTTMQGPQRSLRRLYNASASRDGATLLQTGRTYRRAFAFPPATGRPQHPCRQDRTPPRRGVGGTCSASAGERLSRSPGNDCACLHGELCTEDKQSVWYLRQQKDGRLIHDVGEIFLNDATVRNGLPHSTDVRLAVPADAHAHDERHKGEPSSARHHMGGCRLSRRGRSKGHPEQSAGLMF